MFGSLAWGSGAFISGILIDSYGMDSVFFYTYFFVMINFFCIMIGLPNKGTQKPTLSHSKSDEISQTVSMNTPMRNDLLSYISEMRQFFQSPPCRALLINIFGFGMAMTVPDTFLFISLEKDFHASRTYSGLCTATSIVACIPLFYYSESLLVKYGHFRMIMVAEYSCVIRLFLYSILPPSWPLSIYFILVVQMIHGLNFALLWSAAVDAMDKLSPSSLQTSCMAMLNVMFFTLSGACGNIIWGIVYDHSGNVVVVYWASAVCLIFFIVYFSFTQHIFMSSLVSSHNNGPSIDF
jgi:predicted MFS family arabinose efflux permease